MRKFAALLTLGVVLLTGCNPQSTIAALTQTLGSASASVASIEGNTALAAQLTADTEAAVQIGRAHV